MVITLKITSSDNPSAPAPGIEVNGLCFGFGGQRLFDGFDFTAPAGRWTCILGPSGCGKSTLLRLIAGSLRSDGGTVQFNGHHRQPGTIAWMAQNDLLLPWLSVADNVMLGARLRGQADQKRRHLALEMIAAAGLADSADSLPATLSGGMRQRAALLRTLMEDRPVILMDEPFASVDAITRLKLQDMAAGFLSGATVILVTHDPLEAIRLGHRIHVMGTRPVELGPAHEPPGPLPRRADDPDLARLYGRLLKELAGVEKQCPRA